MPKLKDPRRELFCQEYVVDFNGTRSARDAGFGPKSARVKASQILTEVNIQKRIAELMANRVERTKITQDMVLQELAIVGFSDLKNHAQINEDGQVEFYPFKDVGIETRAIESMKQVDNPSGRSISMKLHGKVKPLELIGRHLGMFVDTHNINLTGDIQVITAVPRSKKKKEPEK